MAGRTGAEFKRIDEDVYADSDGQVYEKKGERFVPTGAKVKALAEQPQEASVSEFAPASELLVRPEMDIEAAKQLWDSFKQFRDYILQDKACFDVILGTKEMNRTGATRLAVPFGLSIEERVTEEYGEGEDKRFKVHVRVSKGRRFVDGGGSCRVSEIESKTKKGEDVPYSQREHFAFTRAWTRATKRGIADILGGTEADTTA